VDSLTLDMSPIVAVTGRTLLILVLTYVVVRVVKRLIKRSVERAKDPERSVTLERLRTRAGLSEAPAVPAIATERKARRVDALGSIFGSVASAFIWTLSLLTILGGFGIELGPYIASLGIVGVALGFGAQDLVKDFISGIFMLLEDQYGVGDVVDSGEAVGVVEGISLRTTRIRSVDGTLWYVPNGEIRRLGNMSQDWARALLDIGVSYDTDVEDASRIIAEVAETMAGEEEYVAKFLDAPEVWGVQNLGPDSIDIRLVIKTTPGDQWAIARELRARIKKAFDEASVEIPFPQRTIWLRTDVTGADDAPRLVTGEGDPDA
jgi:moderate conductance mechanosensitive channel